ncbi:Serine-threonine protein kinase, plant-type, putative [Theobroma cacao]|uniref:non-specific serine/threonine protein kinase n=1 Tax=Theobroma cacao TaxID=3641 RepID=A0A061FEQ2_THECC|nr:Serine-threonine protein kinase, plant-type, putative [Theobroma cacao]
MNFFSHLHFALLAFLVYSKYICLCVESVPLSIVTDKEALISFKSQMSLEPPNPLSYWHQNSSPCNWTGVLCNKPGNRVVALNLSGFGLVGSISPQIGNLSFLRSLELQNNQLRGALPHQIGNLFRLRVLNLSFNSLEGAIPPNISKLTELRVLDLMTNKITGRVPEELIHLMKLQVLNLGRNLLSGAIPPSIANLSSLSTLNLGTNTLSGKIPGDLSRLSNLKYLDLTINNLTGTVPSSIYNMSSLVYLALASNNLWGKLPTDIGDTLPNLLGFNFCFNKFTGTIPGSLHNLTNIKIIRMAHNLLEGTVPPGLGNLPFLEMYNIGFNKIVSLDNDGLGFITSLTNSSRLKFLAFDGNLLEGAIPESIGNLSKVLSKLYMGGNRISGNIPSSIGHLSSLTLLNLSYNSICCEIPPEIGKLEELQMLGLAGNQISGSIPSSLGNLRKLNQIDLSGNQLVGEIPSTFKNFQNLLSLDLSNNMLNGSIAGEILNLPSLSTLLNLSGNFLRGTLPQEIGRLRSIVTIDLSNNRFSGNIPSSIRSCNSLEELFMAENMLSGPIPSALGEVKGLETLDLSSNQLSGSIPADLQKLQVLKSLNLSFNDLEGAIPTGGIFSNLSSVHLEGNPKLCLSSVCKKTQGHGRLLVKVYVSITIIITLAACFIVGLLLYKKKSKVNITEISELLKEQHQIISYDEIRRATESFNPENLIGSGSFGSVYKGCLRDGVRVAVKVLKKERTGSWKSFLAECEALRNVRHRNLVKLITSCSSLDFQNMEFLALVYEFLVNGSVEDWIEGKRRNTNGDGLNIMERLNVAIDVASALDYMHHDCEVPVVHCDLKPSNILLDEDMTAKIGDFGLARLLMESSEAQQSLGSTYDLKGSIGYIPPEYGLGKKPSKAGDVYSYGVMLLELFTGRRPTHESFVGELNLIKWVQSAFPSSMLQILDPELLPLMKNLQNDSQPINPEIQLDCLTTIFGVGLSCTTVSPDGRISMRDAHRKLKTVKDTLNNRSPAKNTEHG